MLYVNNRTFLPSLLHDNDRQSQHQPAILQVIIDRISTTILHFASHLDLYYSAIPVVSYLPTYIPYVIVI